MLIDLQVLIKVLDYVIDSLRCGSVMSNDWLKVEYKKLRM